jgi:NADPH:quinone reductase-like Zn-dependent oxidoreductase
MTTMQGAILLNGAIELQTVQIPTPKTGEVLVKIHAATINPTDVDVQHGKYAAMVNRARKQRPVITGLELSGVVVSDGVTFNQGDEVFGYVNLLKAGMTHAEYAAVPERILAHKPANLSHVEAVTLPIGGLTAHIALHKHAKIQAASRILINGASGGVGIYALQLAKQAGTHITAVCSENNFDLVRELGADTVRNYRSESVLRDGDSFDLIFDVANTLNFAQCRPYLNKRGTYIITDPFKDIGGLVRALFSRQHSPYLMVLSSATPDFQHLTNLTASGKLRPVIGRVFPFQDISAGFAHVESGSKTGRVVVQMV